MNNGKIRIYELSKELNLDNKDIKDICEQLNIAVKSHSSTITDNQAERVRAIAQKHPFTFSRKKNNHKQVKKDKVDELSKELGFSEKDILDICEQLNITINNGTLTELTTDQIRQAAKKYTSSNQIFSIQITKKHKLEKVIKGKRKQQILAIHHKHNN